MYTYGRKTGCRVTLDYTYRGMRIAYLENDLIRVGVLLDKGADIFEFTFKPRDLDFMWQSPIEMRKPFVATNAMSEGAFHDYYYGGWQEVLPAAGWATEPYQGVLQGLHGEVSLLPFEASIIEDSPRRVALRTWTRTYRSPLALERTLSLEQGKPSLFIKERLTNEADSEFAIMWGHHPALGTPFVDEHCVIRTPAKKVEVLAIPDNPNGLWDTGKDYDFPMVQNRRTGKLQDITRVLPRDTKSLDVVFFKGLSEGWYSVTNEKLDVGFGMAWDAKLFKYLWMWEVTTGHLGHPWYGRTYNIALEPFTSYPPAGIQTAIKNGTALIMKPAEVIETDLVAVAYEKKAGSKVSLDGSVSG